MTSKECGLPVGRLPGSESHRLDDQHSVWKGQLPVALLHNATDFQRLWEIHPPDFHLIKIGGQAVRTPRWQQAFGRDYRYTGQVNSALPVPPLLDPLLTWASGVIDPRLNGILVNWYDGQRGHYIGPHRDSTANMVNGAPIVTISLGEERVFRLRPWKRSGFLDLPVCNGAVIVMRLSPRLTQTVKTLPAVR
jgi:alkylated DNA repair dioxygenase AlkB